MEQQIKDLRERAQTEIQSASNLKELDDVRVKFLGKKGELTGLLRGMSQLSAEERPLVGKIVNEARAQLETSIAEKNSELKAAELQNKLASEKIDVTLPGRRVHDGHLHPLTLTLNRVKEIFVSMGYTVEECPEVETDYYNFEALNLPKDHPARDMQDSFYITEEILLRTQTSPVQARTMERHKDNEPIRMIAPGRVYRRDDYDASHSPMFTQVEGLVIDKGVTMADLCGTLELLMKRLYGDDCKIRLRPHHFPYTEPSAEVDVMCYNCNGAGCPLCKNEGYIELLGAGMVHPKVLEGCGIDPEVYSGFAFGVGLERIVMRRFGITDMRLLYENDLRFLEQF